MEFLDLPSNLFCKGDVEILWNIVKDGLNLGTEKFIPKFKLLNWKQKDKWKAPLSKELRELIKKKHRLWHMYIESKSSSALLEYKTIRNRVRKETRNVVPKQQQSIAEICKRNSKKFWQYVNSKSKVNVGMGNIKVLNELEEPVVIKEDAAKAEAFSDFFFSVYNKEVYKAEEVDIIENKASFGIDSISCVEVYDKLKNLNTSKSPGYDNLHPRVLYELKDVICPILCIIINLSFKFEILPVVWKTSVVSAIYKKGNKESVSNYRPISLTCICCKIMESVLRDRLINYLSHNNLISSQQFGFVKGRSATLQLVGLLDDMLKFLDNGSQVDILYTDFEKAFDKIPHQLLLQKLCNYDISGSLLSWIADFLCNRIYTVCINGCLSSFKPVLSGVPQGSVLGPLLFILYINDLPETLEASSCSSLYADDTKLYKCIDTLDDCKVLEQNLNVLLEWCNKWGMTLNFNKCMIVSFHKHGMNTLTYDYHYIDKDANCGIIQRVSSVTDLGVKFDDELSFSFHIYDKIALANKMLGIIKRNFVNMNKECFLLLYKSLVRSHLEYANSVWCPYKVGLINDIERVQRRATKLLVCIKGLSYEKRLEYLKLPTLKFRRLRGDMIEVF